MTYDMVQCERHPSKSNVHSAEFRFWTQLGETKTQKTLNKVDCIVGRGEFLVHTVQNSVWRIVPQEFLNRGLSVPEP